MSYPMENKRKSNVLVWVIVGVAFSCLTLCGVSAYFVINGSQRIAKEMGPLFTCSLEMTALRDATRQWAEQNNGKLPSAANWKSEVRQTYVAELERQKKEVSQAEGFLGIKWSDVNGTWGCSDGKGGRNAFVFNSELAGKALADVDKKPDTIMFFEAPGAVNKSEPYKRRTDKTEPRVFGELRDWMTIPVQGDVNEGIDRGAGSPASRTE